MTNVIDLEAHIKALLELQAPDDLSNSNFLLNEGLELLANFRAIRCDALRKSIIEMISAAAKASDSL